MRYIFIIIIIFLFPTVSGVSADSDFYSTSFTVDVGSLTPINTPLPSGGDSQSSLMSILTMLSNLLLYLMPVLAAISVVVAGYQYMFSMGNSDDTSRAKTILKYNLMALLVAFGSYSIIVFISHNLG